METRSFEYNDMQIYELYNLELITPNKILPDNDYYILDAGILTHKRGRDMSVVEFVHKLGDELIECYRLVNCVKQGSFTTVKDSITTNGKYVDGLKEGSVYNYDSVNDFISRIVYKHGFIHGLCKYTTILEDVSCYRYELYYHDKLVMSFAIRNNVIRNLIYIKNDERYMMNDFGEVVEEVD